MNTEQITTATATSIAAVEQYISLGLKSCNRHRANILVHANGKDLYTGVKIISVKACKGSVEIIIEDFHTIYGNRSNRFTLEDSSFSICCKTLQIKSTDTLGKKITVEITRT